MLSVKVMSVWIGLCIDTLWVVKATYGIILKQLTFIGLPEPFLKRTPLGVPIRVIENYVFW